MKNGSYSVLFFIMIGCVIGLITGMAIIRYGTPGYRAMDKLCEEQYGSGFILDGIYSAHDFTCKNNVLPTVEPTFNITLRG